MEIGTQSMISLGVDLEHIERFSFLRRPGGRAFYERVYSPTERGLFGQDLTGLTLCFTAKEAVAKVLRSGLALGEPGYAACAEIQIQSGRDLSQPRVILVGRARVLAQAQGFSCVLLAWTHDGGLACSLALGTDGTGEETTLRDALSALLWNVSGKLKRSALSAELDVEASEELCRAMI